GDRDRVVHDHRGAAECLRVVVQVVGRELAQGGADRAGRGEFVQPRDVDRTLVGEVHRHQYATHARFGEHAAGSLRIAPQVELRTSGDIAAVHRAAHDHDAVDLRLDLGVGGQ